MGYKTLNLFEETVLREVAHNPLRVDTHGGDFQTKARLQGRFNQSQHDKLEAALVELIRNEYIEEITIGARWSGYRLTPLGRSLLARSSGTAGTNYNVGGNANIAHNSPGTVQSIEFGTLDDDMKQALEDLRLAMKTNDSSALKKVFGYIADKSVDLAISILAQGLTK